MLHFAANLSMLFTELPFLDRFAAAAQQGFRGVEFLFPYAEDKAALRSRLDDHGLTQVLFNAPPGDWLAGERGIAGLPGREAEFAHGFDQALDYCAALGCQRLHVMSGLVPAGAERARHRATLLANLATVLPRARSAGVTLLLEPLNPLDFPGYLIGSLEAALDVIETVGPAGLKLQYDIYHLQMMRGQLLGGFLQHRAKIGHIQIAGVPGRHEPDQLQEINYPQLFAALDAAGYDGWIGCEYRPRAGTVAGLGWLAPARPVIPATCHLDAAPIVTAPDGSEVRILPALQGGSMAQFSLPPGATTKAVIHRTVEEIWYVVSGGGEIWRSQDGSAEIVALRPGVSLTIPRGVAFQFRSFGPARLEIVAITMPPWPGAEEALPIAGPWSPSVR